MYTPGHAKGASSGFGLWAKILRGQLSCKVPKSSIIHQTGHKDFSEAWHFVWEVDIIIIS